MLRPVSTDAAVNDYRIIGLLNGKELRAQGIKPPFPHTTLLRYNWNIIVKYSRAIRVKRDII